LLPGAVGFLVAAGAPVMSRVRDPHVISGVT
jgi:hypothetical protein